MQEQYIVGIYCRLSREDERAGESVSIENQKELLSRYVQEQGWITAEIQAKGKDWKRVDITFASEGVPAEQLEDDGAYTTRYTY